MIKFINRFLRNILLFPLVAMGVLSAFTGNTSGDTTELVPVFYDKTALKYGKPFSILEQFATKSRDIPKYNGCEVYWWKGIPIVVTVTYTGLAAEGESPDAVDLEFQRVKAKVYQHGHVVKVSEFLEMIAIDPELRSRAEKLGEHRAKYINKMYWEAIAKGFYPMRIDADATYEVEGVSSTSTSTTKFVPATAMTAMASAGGVMVITSGNNKGMGGYLTTYSGGAVIVETYPSYALNEICADGDTCKAANTTAITAADPLTCAGAAKAIVVLQTQLASPYDDGYFRGILSPSTQYDIRNDSAWINAQQYAGSKRLFNGEIGEWGGIRWALDSIPWRSAAGTMGTYDASGAVFHTPIFGKDAYAGVRIKGVQDKLVITPKDKTGDPLQLYSTMGWKAIFTGKVLDHTHGVQILSGATSIV
jgi:N4-gp56 family major capsid protein